MTAAIICPGPSWVHHQPADLTIGVNRAAIFVQCDVWCACDLPRIMESGQEVKGRPLLLTQTATINAMTKALVPWPGGSECLDTLPGMKGTKALARIYSATSAIIYAADRGAKTITLYGADWTGTRDADGVAAGANRGEQRWKDEERIFRMLQRELAKDGCTLTRYGDQ